MNLASDVFILLMPIPILWNLKTSKERKVGLIVVFLLGGLSVFLDLFELWGYQLILFDTMQCLRR